MFFWIKKRALWIYFGQACLLGCNRIYQYEKEMYKKA